MNKEDKTKETPKAEQGRYERHDASGETGPKKYSNRLRWDDKAKRYTVVDDEDNLLKDN